MERSRWRTFVFWVVLVEAVGLLSGHLSREGAVNFRELVAQPPLSPPGVVFPVVWSILYALMGISAARICLELPSKERGRGLALFILQLAVIFIWSPVFFVVKDFGAAFLLVVVLWGSGVRHDPSVQQGRSGGRGVADTLSYMADLCRVSQRGDLDIEL